MQESKESKSSNQDINTDGRERDDWKSRYPAEARKEIRFEAVFLFVVFILSAGLLALHLCGCIYGWLNIYLCSVNKLVFDFILSFALSGLLGGIVFGLKYFYRVVAHGYWSQDRRYWRIFSPMISTAIAFIVGWMSVAGIFYAPKEFSNGWAVAFGFLSGYFADTVVGVMANIADRVFGSNSNQKEGKK